MAYGIMIEKYNEGDGEGAEVIRRLRYRFVVPLRFPGRSIFDAFFITKAHA